METYRYFCRRLNHASAAVTVTRKGRVRPVHSVFQLLESLMDRGTAPLMDPRNPYSGTCLVTSQKALTLVASKFCIVNAETGLVNTQK